MEEGQKQNYITLLEAAKLCAYSEPYLRLRSRQGKLKSIKLGKKWVTTAAWIDDYEKRVNEWRQVVTSKKESAPAAFLAAPTEIYKVLEPTIDTPEEQEESKFIRKPALRPVMAFFDDGPLLPPPIPRRRKVMPRAGQIYPLPKKELAVDFADYGWFGALLSGVACALLLFLAVDPGGISKLMDAGLAGSGQANITHRVVIDAGKSLPVQNSSTAKIESDVTAVSDASRQFSEDPLSDLVNAIDSFFKNISATLN
jgi:hypothetical protein